MSAAILEIDNLTFYYGNFKAVDSLSLTVDRGQVCGFIGPNGAGKTTTMRVISTLQLPAYGSVRVKGIDVMQGPHHVKPIIGFMPDFFGVYDNLKVWEYLDFFGTVYGIDHKTVRERTGEVLDLTDLAVKRDSYVEDLSRGMKQRLCLAKTLMHDPELLILDEPASGLDPKARLEIQNLIRNLSCLGKTVFISSHIIGELEDVCTHVAILELGKLIKAGPIESIYLDEPSAPRLLNIRVINPDRIDSALEGHPDVIRIEKANDIFKVSVTNTDQAAAAVVEALVRAGAAPISVEAEKHTLMERFMKVTTGKVQ